MFQVRVSEELMDLLEGFQDILIGVSSFPNLEEMLYRSGEVPMGHGGEEGDKVEIKGGRAECSDEGKRQHLLLMDMDISDKGKEAKEVAQVPCS